MKEEVVYAALAPIFACIFSRDIALSPDLAAKDVSGWDSFRQVEILIAAEARFGLKFTSAEIDGMRCLGDLVAILVARGWLSNACVLAEAAAGRMVQGDSPEDAVMSLPKTLRDVSGLGTQPPSLKGSALVMIDLQNTYREGVMKLDNVEPALAEAAKLLGRAREAGIPIIHVQHDAGAGSPYDVNDRIGAISDEVAPEDGEEIIVKNYPNAFVGTDLQEKLQSAGVKDVILAGFMTHMCINSTARGAFNLGFQPVIVAAATATRDLPNIDGSVLPAAALQAASLAAVADLFAVVTAHESDIKA